MKSRKLKSIEEGLRGIKANRVLIQITRAIKDNVADGGSDMITLEELVQRLEVEWRDIKNAVKDLDRVYNEVNLMFLGQQTAGLDNVAIYINNKN